MKVGRNSQCPCGSGKKYKRCCGLRAQPGFDLSRVAGISIDKEEKQIIYVSKDILINQLCRDAPKIAESFDRLHEKDLREMSELLGSSSFLLMQGFKEASSKNDEMRIVAGSSL
jgi:hypothetical protein